MAAGEHIEVVWRQIKTKKFRGADALEKAKAFRLSMDENCEQIEAFKVVGYETVAYYDEKMNLVEMDG